MKFPLALFLMANLCPQAIAQERAKWQQHWAFQPVERPAIPFRETRSGLSGGNEIDQFIRARLRSLGLKMSTPASREILLRRVSLDLTGLPPSLQERNDFLNDTSPTAYEAVVDRLLKSPSYGEHMARFWLDSARYGDTHGLHLDNYREMWPYRDWTVNAFNSNMAFDQFTIEQLAGDLLPNPTISQIVATGFNRCHVTTGEGGSIVEEVYVRNVVDRVVTTGTVFMGLTLECSRCHDHKYDPLSMKDFYSMFAFFNNIDGGAMDGNKKDPPPVVRVLSEIQIAKITEHKRRMTGLEAQIKKLVAGIKYAEPIADSEEVLNESQEYVWISGDVPAGAKADGGWSFVEAPKPSPSGSKVSTRKAAGRSQHFFTGAAQPLRVGEGDSLFCYVYLDPNNPPKELMLQWNNGTWEHRAYWGENKIEWGSDDSPSRRNRGALPEVGVWTRLEVAAADVGLKPGELINGWAFTQFDGTVFWDRAGIVTKLNQVSSYASLKLWARDQKALKNTALPKPITGLIAIDAGKRTDQQRVALENYFVEHISSETRETFDPLHKQVTDLKQKVVSIESAAPTTLIFRERSDQKPAFILTRGEYDKRGDQVKRAVPAMFPALPSDSPVNRLGLARWLVSREHPLTSRVAVNRFWQQLFGLGLVKTSEDFGTQGEPPSHPELLDWLASEFMDGGWDVKLLMKRIVMSSTYRQSSKVTPELHQRDPENRFLARGPRYRLDAESLRDQALTVAGLMVQRLGGPSVKPPQPGGLWFAVGYSGSNTVRFKSDQGNDKVHRRSLYTFIKRTAPPPQMSTFDAPSREACTVRRERTNTPLQALLLMNDPQFVEAARNLAVRGMLHGSASPDRVARYLLLLCTAREPESAEVNEIVSLYRDQLNHYATRPKDALALIQNKKMDNVDLSKPAELAAWTIVANLILNLDEVLTKN